MRATIAVAVMLAGCGRIDFDATRPTDGAIDTPVARIQAAAAPCCGGGTSETLALANNVTAGNTIAVLIGWFSTSPAVTASITSLTDTLGNGYTLVPSSYALEPNVVGYGNGNFYSEIGFVTDSAPGADAITFTLSASVTFSLLYVMELTPSTLDVASGGTGSSEFPNAGTVITSTDGELAVAMTDMDQSTSTGTGLGPGAGWTMESHGVAMAIFGQEYVVQPVAGSLTGDFTGMGGAGQWMASMAAFKPR